MFQIEKEEQTAVDAKAVVQREDQYATTDWNDPALSAPMEENVSLVQSIMSFVFKQYLLYPDLLRFSEVTIG